MDELAKLAVKYGTDKWEKHSYIPTYFDMFNKIRFSVKKVLEIGILEGASLFMWRDFFPNAQIYGIDVNEECIKLMEGEKRIKAFKYDQTSTEDLHELIDKIGSDLDIVIDDGSHVQKHQYNTCLTLMPLLNKDVTYIIEDVRVARNIIKRIKNHYDYEELGFHKGRRHDDRLIVVKHKNG